MSALAVSSEVLTVEEAAAVLRVGRSAAYAAVKAGQIPSIKVGRCLRVPRRRLELMLGLNEVEPGDQTGLDEKVVTAPDHGES